MERPFSEEPEESNEGGASRSRMLLLVLLLLVAVAGYLYFFTDLIMPRKAAEQPQPVVQQVKQPMPKKTEVAPSSPTPAPVEQKPAEPPAQPSKTAPAATVKEPQKLPVPPVKSAVANVEPQKVAQTDKTASKPVQAKNDPVKHVRKSESTAGEKKPTKGSTKEQSKAVVVKGGSGKSPSGQKTVGACMILVGEYVLDSQLARDREKIDKAGLEATVTNVGKKPATMHRLFMADYADHAGAVTALTKLKTAGGQGFMLEENGRYSIYAGSYFIENKAAIEQKRLAAKGIKLIVRTATVSMPASRLSAGRYASGEEAASALKKLVKQGLKGKLVPLDEK